MLRSTSSLWNQLLKEITTSLPAWIMPGHVSKTTLLAYPYLRTLSLKSNTSVEDEDMVDMTRLTVLDLSWNALLTNKCLSFTLLHTLNLRCAAHITDEGLSTLVNLTDLNLAQNSRITDDGLSKLHKLKILSLESNQRISDRGVSGLTSLTSLNLTDNKCISINAIACLVQLLELDLTRNYSVSLETATPATMPCLTTLTSLNIQRSKRNMITDAQFQFLSNSLIQLNLLGCNWGSYSNHGISSLTRLQFLNLSYNSIVSDAALSNLVSLTHLNLSNNNNITDNSLMFLRNLTFLDVDRNDNITSGSIQYLSKLSQLRLSSYSSTNYHLFMKMGNSQ